jgi:hypothetical protein
MKKTKQDNILYMEVSPEAWEKDVIKTLGLLHNLKTVYVTNKHSQDIIDLYFHVNKKIKFKILTNNGDMELEGVILDILPYEHKRNVLDCLFLPLSNFHLFNPQKIIEEFNVGVKFCHFINISSIHNVITIK